MEREAACCPVCTLYLREGISLQAHLETHSKDKVIEALLKVAANRTTEQTVSPSPSSVSVGSDTFAATQPYVAPNTSFVSQTQNYVNPQTQVTAAVTYQQFVTGNGSAIMPQYIQVPTIVGPNSNVPDANQALNYMANQQNAYAHTMYNPLYNPYIPQPYPFVQPIYTSMPVASESNTQVNTSQVSNSATPSTSNQIVKQKQALKQVSTVSTNTGSVKDFPVKPKPKKSPMKSTMHTKYRIIRQFGSRTKTTTCMGTVATKSHKIMSINSKSSSTSKTAVISKAKSIKTKYRPLLPKPSPSRIVVPPLIGITTSPNSPEGPTPPLAQVSSISPVENADPNVIDIVKTEKSASEIGEILSKPEETEENWENVKYDEDFFLEGHEVPSMTSVIVDSNRAIQITRNIVINTPATPERENISNSQGDSSNEATGVESMTDNREVQAESRSNSREDLVAEEDGTEKEVQYYESDDDEKHLLEDVFQTFEYEEENKINFSVSTPTASKENGEINMDKNNSECDVYIREDISFANGCEINTVNKETDEIVENVTHSSPYDGANTDVNETGSASVPVFNGSFSLVKPEERAAQTGEARNAADLSCITYTDLQPASSSKVLQDLGIATSFELNNFMEVDGIKIFFNNTNVQHIPLEPIIKFTSTLKNGVSKVQNLVKAENEPRDNSAVVESVIHLVSGTPKNDFSGETNPSSNSDAHLDLRDLSPLTLNIRADESMPARGELSEQESLGAENSNWGLFQSENSSNNVTEIVKTENVTAATGETDREVSDLTNKTFKCLHCPEVFTCIKARRLHKSTAHEKSHSSVTRKPKTFICSHCKEKFTSLTDRRRHVIQNHYFDGKKVVEIKEEREMREENGMQNGREDMVMSSALIKLEQDETAMKNESSADVENLKGSCEVTRHCPECGLRFTGSKKIREHLREVHGVARYKCGTCSETFDMEREYNSHLRIHPLECNQCGKMFSRKPNLTLHLKRHLVIKPYACMQCPKSFVTRQKLDEHMNGHSGNKPLKCSLCDSTFSRHSNLIQHRNIHHLQGKKKVKDYVCRCGDVFHSMRKLEWHKEVHDKKPKTCPFCSQKFIHTTSVTRHIRRSHIPDYLPNEKKDNENIQCPVCGKVYLRSSLIVHMRVHSGEKPFVCKICNKRFTTKWNLELHNWTHQSRNTMPFKCNVCKSAFFREVDFIAHSNSHRNYRPYTCNVCGQKFIRKYNCLRHQDEHKKEKKFLCTFTGCGKSFHRSYYLRDHVKVHTGVRPFTCHICGKASSTKSNHNKHVRIHDTRELLNTEN